MRLLQRMDGHLAFGIKVYDPFIREKIVENQYMDFEEFLNEIDIIVIMVAHDHIRKIMSDVKSKIVLDTRNICIFEGVYKL